MSGLLQRLGRDRVSLALVGVLLLLALFTAWQLARVKADDAQNTTVATPSAAGVPVSEVVTALEQVPTSSPALALQRWKTGNGATVYFVPAPELPMLDIRVIFDGGGARDGGLAGLARFTSAMIGEGTTSRSVDEVNSGFENVGADFGAASYRDMAIANLRSLTRPESLEPAIALFVDVLANPAFPRDDVERIRNQMLVGLARAEEDPGTIASRAFMAALYLAHPYASPPEGTVDTVKRIGIEDMRAFHRRYYVAGNARIAIVGALDRVQAEDIASRIASALPSGQAAPALPAPPDAKGGHFHVKYDSQQTHILVGLPALARHDPDEAALRLGNEVLGGGGLTSLLGEEVRNKRGLAYGAGSGFQPMRARGPFVVNLQTRNESAGEALGVTLATLKQFIAAGPDTAQLDDARRQLVGSYPLQLASNDAIADTLGMMAFYGLPDDYLAQQLARYQTLDQASVRKAFAAHVPDSQLIVVTLGPEKPVPTTGKPATPAAGAPVATPAPPATAAAKP